jgi:hypothetical protein
MAEIVQRAEGRREAEGTELRAQLVHVNEALAQLLQRELQRETEAKERENERE